MSKQRKPFKETKVYGIIKSIANIAIDVLPIPDPRKYFDKDQDGKVDLKDLSQLKWVEFAAAIGVCAFLVYFEIVSLDQLLTIIKTLFN